MKSFARYVVCFILVSLVAWIVPNSSCAKEVRILYESVYPKGHIRFKFIEDALNQIESRSKGTIKFDRHYGEPVSKKLALNGLSRGTIDMLVAYPVYYDGKIAIGDWQQLPGNFRSWQDCYDTCVVGEVAKIMDETYRKKANAVYIGLSPIAPYNFQVSKKAKKIRKLSDFKGMKIRASGGSASIAVKALGGSPVQTIGGEYYQAMQRGIVDAGLMTTYSLKQYHLWEVSNEVVDPPLIGFAAAFIWMNLDTWNKLSLDQRNLIVNTIRSKKLWEKWMANYNKQDEEIIKEAQKRGVEFYTLPKADAEKMYELTSGVWDWYIEQCKKQGLGELAVKVKDIIKARFNKK